MRPSLGPKERPRALDDSVSLGITGSSESLPKTVLRPSGLMVEDVSSSERSAQAQAGATWTCFALAMVAELLLA